MPESGAVKQTYVYSYRGGGVREVSVYKKEIKSSELAKLDCPEQYGTYQIAAKGNFIPSDKRDNGQLIERYSMDGSFRLNSEDALGSKTEYKHNDIRSVLSNFKRRNAVESQIRQ